MIVEDLGCAEGFEVGGVLGRGGGQDVVAGGDGELDCVAADAAGAAPDQEGLAC